MQLIQMPRGFGKSMALIKLMALDDNIVCIVVNEKMVEHMANMLYGYLADHRPVTVMGKTPKHFRDRFLTVHDWGTTGRMKRPSKVYVDDLDMVLAQFLGIGVDIATYSPPQQYERP